MELPCLVKHPEGTVAQGSRNSGPCLRSEIQASPQNLPQDGLKRLNSKPICTYIYIYYACMGDEHQFAIISQLF